MKKVKIAMLILAVFFVMPIAANAGSIGVYCWQLAPHVDVVCFDVDSKGFAMGAIGWDHAPASYKYPAHGAICVDDYWNVYSFEWTVFMTNFAADIDPSTLDGVWYDFTGDSGDFLFIGPGPQAEGVVEGIGARFQGRR